MDLNYKNRKREKKIEQYRKNFQNQRHLEQIDNGMNIIDEIKNGEKKIRKLSNEKVLNQSATILYTKFIDVAKQHHVCPLCTRAMNDFEMGNFVKINETKLQQVASGHALRENEKKMKITQKNLDSLKQMRPIWEDYKRLKEYEQDRINEEKGILLNKKKRYL